MQRCYSRCEVSQYMSSVYPIALQAYSRPGELSVENHRSVDLSLFFLSLIFDKILKTQPVSIAVWQSAITCDCLRCHSLTSLIVWTAKSLKVFIWRTLGSRKQQGKREHIATVLRRKIAKKMTTKDSVTHANKSFLVHLLPTRNVESNHLRSVIELHCEACLSTLRLFEII